MYTPLLVLISALLEKTPHPFPGPDEAVVDKTTFHIGSRKSQLALVQSEQVQAQLTKQHAGLDFPIVTMSTLGDRVLDLALSKIGEKSLFTKDLEVALFDRRVDLVVHSLKDLPTVLPEGMTLGAILKREDPRDAVVMSEKNQGLTLATLPKGSVIGTSSVRRIAQLKRAYPDLEFMDVRGNLNTRLAKLDNPSGPFSALILAAAGLIRLNWSHRISEHLAPSISLHAVSQGALGIECRTDDTETLELLRPLNDRDTVLQCLAERALLRTLEGGCSVPIGVNSWFVGEEGGPRELKLRGVVASLDGATAMYAEHGVRVGWEAEIEEEEVAAELGRKVARDLLEQGAGAILKELTKGREVIRTAAV